MSEPFVLGPYDALRMQSLSASGSGIDTGSLVLLAGSECQLAEVAVDAQVYLAAPRMVELLSYLGPEFVVGPPMPTATTP